MGKTIEQLREQGEKEIAEREKVARDLEEAKAKSEGEAWEWFYLCLCNHFGTELACTYRLGGEEAQSACAPERGYAKSIVFYPFGEMPIKACVIPNGDGIDPRPAGNDGNLFHAVKNFSIQPVDGALPESILVTEWYCTDSIAEAVAVSFRSYCDYCNRSAEPKVPGEQKKNDIPF